MFFQRMRLRRLPAAVVMAAGMLSWALLPAAAARAETKPAVAAATPEKKSDAVTKTASVPPAAEKQLATKPKKKIHAPTLHATIDLTAQRMTVTTSTGATHAWKISSGRRGYETPTGRFRPNWMARRWYSRKYDLAPMPYAVFFNGGIATHGTQSTRLLGRPASHGCVRLRTANARTFYHLVRKYGRANTRIVVTGHAKQRPNVVARRRGTYQRRAAGSRRVYRYAEPPSYWQPDDGPYYRRRGRSAYARPYYPFVYPGDAPPYGYYRPY